VNAYPTGNNPRKQVKNNTTLTATIEQDELPTENRPEPVQRPSQVLSGNKSTRRPPPIKNSPIFQTITKKSKKLQEVKSNNEIASTAANSATVSSTPGQDLDATTVATTRVQSTETPRLSASSNIVIDTSPRTKNALVESIVETPATPTPLNVEEETTPLTPTADSPNDDSAYAWLTDNFITQFFKGMFNRIDRYTVILTSAFLIGVLLIGAFIAIAICVCKR
jgi:hypothetical protein